MIVLYRSNRFHMEELETRRPQGGVLKSFLGCIGPVNSHSLSYLSVNFPAMESWRDSREPIGSEKIVCRHCSFSEEHVPG